VLLVVGLQTHRLSSWALAYNNELSYGRQRFPVANMNRDSFMGESPCLACCALLAE
jgi:hypothetical protein